MSSKTFSIWASSIDWDDWLILQCRLTSCRQRQWKRKAAKKIEVILVWIFVSLVLGNHGVQSTNRSSIGYNLIKEKNNAAQQKQEWGKTDRKRVETEPIEVSEGMDLQDGENEKQENV